MQLVVLLSVLRSKKPSKNSCHIKKAVFLSSLVQATAGLRSCVNADSSVRLWSGFS